MPVTVPGVGLYGASAEPAIVLVCQAGTSFTQPQSNRTVPPRLGSWTCSTPCSSSQLAISTIATHSAPVRVATPTASAMWSTCPWVIAMWVGSTSSALATAAGLLGFEERVDEDRGLALAQLEARMAVELDLHLSALSFAVVVVVHLAHAVPSRRRPQPSCPSSPPRRAASARRRRARRGRGRWPPSASRRRATRRTSHPRPAPRRAPAAAGAPPGRRSARPRRSARHRSAARSRPPAARPTARAMEPSPSCRAAAAARPARAPTSAADQAGKRIGGRLEDRQCQQHHGGDA